MSPTKRVRKNQSSLGKEIPDGRFAQVIADALHREFGETHAAVKTVVGLTKANERAVKKLVYWRRTVQLGSTWWIWSEPPMRCSKRFY